MIGQLKRTTPAIELVVVVSITTMAAVVLRLIAAAVLRRAATAALDFEQLYICNPVPLYVKINALIWAFIFCLTIS